MWSAEIRLKCSFATLVIHRRPARQPLGKGGRIERLIRGFRKQLLGEIEHRPAVAIRHRQHRLATLCGHRQTAALHRLGATEQCLQIGCPQPTQGQHLQPRKQRGVELERRIFGRGTGQQDGAVLDRGQKSILLGAVETMDLVHEQKGSDTAELALLRLRENLAQIGNATEYRAQRDIDLTARLRQKPRDGGLSDPGCPPEHE